MRRQSDRSATSQREVVEKGIRNISSEGGRLRQRHGIVEFDTTVLYCPYNSELQKKVIIMDGGAVRRISIDITCPSNNHPPSTDAVTPFLSDINLPTVTDTKARGPLFALFLPHVGCGAAGKKSL